MTKEEFNKKWPMTKIPDSIREVAVTWGDAHHWFIEDKVKLAQDILEATDKHIRELNKQQAIAFAEWMEGRLRLPNGNWRVGHLLEETTEERYNKFLSQTELA